MRRYLLIGTAAALLAIPALATGATTTITVSPNNSLSFGPKSVTKNVGAGDIHPCRSGSRQRNAPIRWVNGEMDILDVFLR